MTKSERSPASGDLAAAWDERIGRLLLRLPSAVTSRIQWLRHRDRYVVRLAAGILLVIGGILSILPILGIWMLPLGLALLAEDFPGIKPSLERMARWLESILRRFTSKPGIGKKLSPPKG